MAITVNWGTGVIFVPQADLTMISATLYEMDANDFRLELKGLEDDATGGMPHLRTNDHNTEVVLSGVTYARIIEILAPYTIEWEDGQYAVQIVGANHNFADRKVLNQVSLIIGNSAGLIQGNISTQLVEGGLTVADVLRILLAGDAGNVSGGGTSTITIVAADGSKTRVIATVDANGNRTVTFLDGSL